MRRYSQNALNFTKAQIQRLKRSDRSLRNLNLEATIALARVGRMSLTSTKYGEASISLRTIALQMISILRIRQNLVEAVARGEWDRIQVVFGAECDKCSEIEKFRRPNDDQTAFLEILKIDPKHQEEIERVVDLAIRIQERISKGRKTRKPIPTAFVLSLGRLTAVLLRQIEQLLETAPKQAPEIEVIHEFKNCLSCHSLLSEELEMDYEKEKIAAEETWQQNQKLGTIYESQ